MPKFKKQEKELSTHLEYWIWYLNNLAKIDNIPKKLQDYSVLNKAFDVAKFLALSKDKQLAYQLDLKAKLDYQNVMDYAKEFAREEGREEGRRKGIKEGIEKGIEEGVEKGMEKGKKEEKIKIAKISLKQNIDIATIAMITNLTIEEIANLKG